MSDHFSRCPWVPYDSDGRECQCELIAEVRDDVCREITDFVNAEWPEKSMKEGGSTYVSVRAIILEWAQRTVRHIAKGGSRG